MPCHDHGLSGKGWLYASPFHSSVRTSMLASSGNAAQRRGTIRGTLHLPHPALLSRAWPTEDPLEHPRDYRPGQGWRMPEPSWRQTVSLNWGIPHSGPHGEKAAQMAPEHNTHCPVLAKYVLASYLFHYSQEAGSLSKRNHTGRTSMGLSILPPLLLLPS